MKWSGSYGTGIASGAHFKALGKGGKHGSFSFALPFFTSQTGPGKQCVHPLLTDGRFIQMTPSWNFLIGNFLSWKLPFLKFSVRDFSFMENSSHGIFLFMKSRFFLEFS